MLARFDHPHIVKVHSYFEDHGTGYLVMDYYEGQTLATILANRGGVLPEAEAVQIIQDVLEGLQPIHEQGVLHRDIDPQNIYQTTDGQVVLIDFGAAREAVGERSQSLSAILKPGFAPYEQYHDGDEQGPWTDVYACAATLYKCLTGLRPPEATRRLREDDLVSPREARANVSMDLSLAVMKGLALHPEQRPTSATAYAQLLKETQQDNGSTVQAPDGAAREPSVADTESDPPPPAADAQSPPEIQDDLPDRGTVGQWAFPVAVASVLGIMLGFDDGGASVVSFVGTWLIVSLGIVGLFRQAEHAMTPESRAAVRDWLLQQDLVSQSQNWPSTFTSLFDAVFTKAHFSWTCFQRSAAVSVTSVIVILIGLAGVGLMSVEQTWQALAGNEGSAWYNFLTFLIWAMALNIIVDYLSLLETRIVLGRMSQTDQTSTHLAYLGLDLILTSLIYVGVLCAIQPFLLLIFQKVSVTTLFTAEAAQRTWDAIQNALYATWTGIRSVNNPGVVTVYSTLFTSVWVWLYAGAGLALQLLYPMLRGLDVLKRHFDVETRPVHTMGILLAVVTTGVFVLASPFVL